MVDVAEDCILPSVGLSGDVLDVFDDVVDDFIRCSIGTFGDVLDLIENLHPVGMSGDIFGRWSAFKQTTFCTQASAVAECDKRVP